MTDATLDRLDELAHPEAHAELWRRFDGSPEWALEAAGAALDAYWGLLDCVLAADGGA